MIVWLLSVLGVGVLDVIVLHFTENTRMSKTIKTVCSVIFVFVIIYPLPGLFSGTLEFDSVTFNFSIEMDSALPDIIYESERKLIESTVERALLNDGYDVEISIDAEFDGVNMTIKSVRAKSEKYYYEIISKISEYLDIDKEYIYIDVTG